MKIRCNLRVWFSSVAVVALCATSAPSFAQLAHVTVSDGALSGKTGGEVAAFLGVPFAAPPTGDDRWKPPRPAAKWEGERQADQFAASCQQAVTPDGFGPWTREYVVQGRVSEDCLYLNVWTPAKTSGDRLPVLFWIYGGGFTSGSGSVPIYDGAALAAKGIIVVNVNYRVGVYGFLAHPELTAESPVHASGNYGLLDQLAALRWVRVNIAAFGGDPTKVTIAGQSAGAAAVHHLIASPLAAGLFARAMAESGSGMGLRVPEHAEAEKLGQQLGNADGKTLSLAALRALSTTQLDARVAKMGGGSGPGSRFGPVVDGLFLPNAQSVGKNENDTPILTGMTANETTGLNPAYGKTTVASFTEQVTATYGATAADVQALYPAKDDAQAWTSLDALARDRGLAAMYFWAQERARKSRHPIYAYLWTHPEPGPEADRYGAFHSSEIPYVFATLDTARRPFEKADRGLAEQLGGYWVNFVKGGDPNGKRLTTWPKFTDEQKQILELGDRTRDRAILPARQIDVFERYVKSGGALGLF